MSDPPTPGLASRNLTHRPWDQPRSFPTWTPMCTKCCRHRGGHAAVCRRGLLETTSALGRCVRGTGPRGETRKWRTRQEEKAADKAHTGEHTAGRGLPPFHGITRMCTCVARGTHRTARVLFCFLQ